MFFQVLSSRAPALPQGWRAETLISAFSSGKVDASAPPGDGAKLTIYSFLSSTTVLVPAGCRVQMSGGDILGSHSVRVKPEADGPQVEIRAIPILASIKVRSSA